MQHKERVSVTWDSENRRYILTCDHCHLFDTFTYPAPYQPGEARIKAGAAWRKHIDKHKAPANTAEREARVRAAKRTGGNVRRAKPLPPGTYDPPPF